MKTPHPLLRIGMVIELETTGLARGGAAVGKTDSGFVIFIQGAAPQERVRVRIESVKKNFATAQVLDVLQPSVDRVQPECVYFGECGGCAWQHVSYSAQLREKQRIVAKALKGLVPEDFISPIVASPKVFRYRNRVALNVVNGRPVMKRRAGKSGASGSRSTLPIEDCLIAAEGLVASAVEAASRNPDLKRAAVQSAALGDDSVEVSGFTQINPEQNEALRAWLIRSVETVLGLRAAAGSSSESETESESGSPARFDDVTSESSAVRTVLDLYCGDGNLSLPLVTRFPHLEVIGYDLGTESIARANAAVNGGDFKLDLKPVYKAATAEAGISECNAQKRQFDLVIIDPPRIGASEEAVRGLADLLSRWFVYVSCDPMTLSRDLRRLEVHLAQKNLQLEYRAVVPFDFFPQTDHVEVAIFARVKSK